MSMRRFGTGVAVSAALAAAVGVGAGLGAAASGPDDPVRLSQDSVHEVAATLGASWGSAWGREPVWDFTFVRVNTEFKFVKVLACSGVLHALVVGDDFGGTPVVSVRDGSGQVISLTRGSVTLDVPFKEGLEINTGNSAAVLTVLYRAGR